jgi:phosphoenolpyruvate-protein kinase (PTS system EI component)
LRLQQKENLENDYKVEIDSLMEELEAKGKQMKSLEAQKKSTPAVLDTAVRDLQIEALQDEILSLRSEKGLLQKNLETARAAEPVESWNDTIRDELSNLQVKYICYF